LARDGHDLKAIVTQRRVDPAGPGVSFVFPHCAEAADTSTAAAHARVVRIPAWKIAQRQDETGLRSSSWGRSMTWAGEVERGIRQRKHPVGRLSREAAIVLGAASAARGRCADIIALSTYMPMAEKTDAGKQSDAIAPPFPRHGMLDPTIRNALGAHEPGDIVRAAQRSTGTPTSWASGQHGGITRTCVAGSERRLGGGVRSLAPCPSAPPRPQSPHSPPAAAMVCRFCSLTVLFAVMADRRNAGVVVGIARTTRRGVSHAAGAAQERVRAVAGVMCAVSL